MEKIILKITRFISKKWFWLLYTFKPIWIPAFPNYICIDACTHCNLHCPACPNGKGVKDFSRGFLKFEDFKKFIDRYKYFIEKMRLSNLGELFINPEIFKIIKYAEDAGIQTYADSNLNYFNDSMAEELVKSNMSELCVAVDGASAETYVQYRHGGDFNKVINNIKSINKYKEKYSTSKPYLIWQFVIFDHNQHEIEQAQQKAEELNMKFRLRENWEKNFSAPDQNNPETNRSIQGFCDSIETLCHSIWYLPVINYSGNMSGCCVIYSDKYSLGNVFDKGFFKIYNGKKMRTLRKVVLKKITPPNYIYCSRCNYYDLFFKDNQ